MNRSCVWLATLTAATLATVAEAPAFTLESPGGSRLGHLVAGPEPRAPAQAIAKPDSGPPGGYTFSGNSFNLSVTKNGRSAPAAPEPPRVTAPGESPGASRPGLIRRLFDWVTGD
jgi:hypothetical protein